MKKNSLSPPPEFAVNSHVSAGANNGRGPRAWPHPDCFARGVEGLPCGTWQGTGKPEAAVTFLGWDVLEQQSSATSAARSLPLQCEVGVVAK